jgi:hypothetical protein
MSALEVGELQRAARSETRPQQRGDRAQTPFPPQAPA